MSNQAEREQWTSRWGFVAAATGAAAGLGNIWKFPYVVGEHGGGAFMLVYLTAIVAVGLPILSAELLLGRLGNRNIVDGLSRVARDGGHSPRWAWLGWMGIAALFVILSFYSVVGGWTLAYLHLALTGATSPGGASPEYFAQLFARLTESPARTVLWHTVFMGTTAIVVGSGVRRGIERLSRVLVPVLLLLMAVLAVHNAMTTNHFSAAVSFLFEPDFTKLTGDAVLVAVGHAFFTLSIGVGAMLTFGSYVPRRNGLAGAAVTIAVLDTIVAVLAGLVVFPVVLANDMQVSSGPGLAFVTLPVAFDGLGAAMPVGVLFFGVLAIAALTSSPSLLEPIVELARERTGLNRGAAAAAISSLIWAAGLAQALSMSADVELEVFGRSLFEASDYLTSRLLLPAGGIMIALFAGWRLRTSDAHGLFDERSRAARRAWQFTLRFVVPVLIAITLVNGL